MWDSFIGSGTTPTPSCTLPHNYFLNDFWDWIIQKWEKDVFLKIIFHFGIYMFYLYSDSVSQKAETQVLICWSL